MLKTCIIFAVYYKDPKKLSACNTNQKIKLGRYLVIGINFFRECVSAFADQRDMELRIKVWLRLSNIVFLQQLFVQHFGEFPILPVAYAGESLGSTAAGDFGDLFILRKNPALKSAKTTNKKANKTDGNEKENSKKKGSESTKSKSKKKKTKDDGEEEQEQRSKQVKVFELEDTIQPKFLELYLRRFDAKVLIKVVINFIQVFQQLY